MVGATPPPAACRTCGARFPDDVLICPHDGAHLPLEGRLLDGKFRLERRLGQGSMATVWRAIHELIERPVAIKLMRTSYAADADLLARFRNEATAAGRIGSPHICDVLDFGRSAIGPYIVMELLSGCPLCDLMQARHRLEPGLAVWLMRQALDGLDAAHQAGIIHRDLKPENIYVCRAIRDQWLVKLMDFGISKFVDSLRTGAGTMMGSPNYMAPEQIHGAGTVDARADVWSVGAILYEALTGQQAFARDNIADSLAAVRNYDPPPVHSLVPEVPPGLSEIVARCLRKQPDRRWPSARALADALLPYEHPGEPALLLPSAAAGDDASALVTTQPRMAALPRSLAAAPAARSTGAHPPVSSARPTGAHPPVSSARSTGPHPPVSSARATGPHPPVSNARATGPHPPVPGARSTGPHPPVPGPRATGPHPPVSGAKKTGSHLPVPSARATGSHSPVQSARPVGSHLPAPRSISGPYPPVAAARSTGPHPPVSDARSTGRHTPVSLHAEGTGPHPPVPERAASEPAPRARPAAPATKSPAAPVRKAIRTAPVPSARRRHPGGLDPLFIALILAAVGVTAATVAWLAT